MDCMPHEVAAGTTLKYSRLYTNFPPSDGWTLKLFLRGKSIQDVTATVVDGRHEFNCTVDLEAGSYIWVERAYRDEEVHQLARGRLQVTPDVESAGEGDLQSWAEQAYEVVVAKLQNRLTKDQESFQINGVAVTRIPTETLLRLRRDLEARIHAERTGRIGTSIPIHFGDPRMWS